VSITVVIPTVGRASLAATLRPLIGVLPVTVVDDRPERFPLDVPAEVTVLRSCGRGPAAARNLGWQHAKSTWVAFLDDDVEPPDDWPDSLQADLAAVGPDVGAVQGRVVVPTSDPPTDTERTTKGLETALWATADIAYQRRVLAAVGGFDERFPRAYREDADLGLRVTAAGWMIVRGERQVLHPVRPALWTQSIGSQRGNADDVLMTALHGRGWRQRAQAPMGRRPRHLLTTAALAAGLVPRWRRRGLLVWALLTAEFACSRRTTAREMASLAATSVAIPPTATWWWLVGWAKLPGQLSRGGPVPR
jgi:hypothetical protein